MLHQNAFWAFRQGVCVAIWFIESITAVRGWCIEPAVSKEIDA